ncbi:MAG: hypothetical protein P4M14_01330 [Gammaproteobacteria bacterium]|nr:hypothetical protein [Gammaproteobacteria bacterium]
MTDTESEPQEECIPREDEHKQDAYITVLNSAPIHHFLYGRSLSDDATKAESPKTKTKR